MVIKTWSAKEAALKVGGSSFLRVKALQFLSLFLLDLSLPDFSHSQTFFPFQPSISPPLSIPLTVLFSLVTLSGSLLPKTLAFSSSFYLLKPVKPQLSLSVVPTFFCFADLRPSLFFNFPAVSRCFLSSTPPQTSSSLSLPHFHPHLSSLSVPLLPLPDFQP